MGHQAEERYRQAFGPFVAGEHAIGDMVTFDQGRMAGTVVWSFVDETEEEGTPDRFAYAVLCDGQELPMEVEPGDIL